MVVNIHGTLDDDEYKYGLLIKDIFEIDFLIKSDENKIDIIPSVQCYGQDVEDIDIVVFGNFDNYCNDVRCKINNLNEDLTLRNIQIQNFCSVIEVKKHDLSNLIFNKSNLLVKYGNKEHNATIQNRNQVFALKNYLSLNDMRITNFIFLPNVSRKQLSNELKDLNDQVYENGDKNIMSRILFSDSSLHDFWFKLLLQKNPFKAFDGRIIFKSSYKTYLKGNINKYVDGLTKKMTASRLDREKIERISKRKLKKQKYEDKLGKQLLIFRGKGGTGKTYHLLSIAHDLYEIYSYRVLILTYNKALVADIKRLFALMKISGGVGRSIQITTLHSFWWKIYIATGIAEKYPNENCYDNKIYKYELKKYLDEKKSKLELKELSRDHPELFSWDFVMVDEAQDWPPDERDLLYKIFGFKNIIIADGINQLIRNKIPCNWRDHPEINTGNSQVVPLRMSLRQTSNLNSFVREFSEKLGLEDWNVEKNDEAYGGRVIIIEGKYDIKTHKQLMKQNTDAKNENIDMLFCVPPSNIDKEKKKSLMAKLLEDNGYSTWDGTDENIRKKYPTSLEQFRIVQYDSCRGLEGWVSVNIDFDKFYNYKLRTYRPEKGQQDFIPDNDKKIAYAGNWLLVPLTRAIDTLVINISDKPSPLYNILKEIYESNKEYIEWRVCK